MSNTSKKQTMEQISLYGKEIEILMTNEKNEVMSEINKEVTQKEIDDSYK